jgi:hypothetical protein
VTAVEKRAKGKGRGGPARNYSWEPFEPGHELSIRHGAYATLHLRPRAEEIATRLREALGDEFEDKFTPALEAASLAAARVERALGHVLSPDVTEDKLAEKLDANARAWLRLYVQTLESLGLTPKIGTNGVSGPVTLVIATAFPGVRGEVVDASDVRELESGEESLPGRLDEKSADAA